MTFYVDTSVLMSILVQDRHTSRAKTWYAEKPRMLISMWALAEVSSVLAIRVRQGVLTPAEAEHGEQQIAAMTYDPLSVEPVAPDDVVGARRLVRSSGTLRAPDALHLAIALRLSLPMATFDGNLMKAAIAAGCSVIDL